VLTLSNLVLAAGLVLLGIAQGFVTLAVAWAVLGVGMAMGLYDPAFATLAGLYVPSMGGPSAAPVWVRRRAPPRLLNRVFEAELIEDSAILESS
jgi:hypothetical protein